MGGLRACSDTLGYVDLISISLVLYFFSLKSQPLVISLPLSTDKKEGSDAELMVSGFSPVSEVHFLQALAEPCQADIFNNTMCSY